MANRPCKPDADTKRLWQMLMPGVAMPSCGIADEADAGENDKAAPSSRDTKTPHDKN
jgi:hypothetical protein